MHHKKHLHKRIYVLIVSLMVIAPLCTLAQTDTTFTAQEKATEKEPPGEKKEKHKKKSTSFKLYAGLTINDLNVQEDRYNSEWIPGFTLGGSYKRGKLFYWEAGVQYNNAVYFLEDPANPRSNNDPEDEIFGSRRIGIPLNVGMNFLWFTSKIVGLRAYVGVAPSFLLDIGDNYLGITESDVNSFVLHGQAGIGVDVLFLFVETGFSFGLTDYLKDTPSKPSQAFLNLGFRF